MTKLLKSKKQDSVSKKEEKSKKKLSKGDDTEVNSRKTFPKSQKKTQDIPEKEENAKDVLRAVKRAARVKRKPIPAGTDVFYVGEQASPRQNAVKRLAEGGAKVPRAKRSRRSRVTYFSQVSLKNGSYSLAIR